MPRHWTLEEATAALPDVRATVRRIRELVAEAHAATESPVAPKPTSNGHGPSKGTDTTELRGLIEELTSHGIVVRDPERGLVDFPARSPSGRTYLLCWLDGEDEIGWWHWPDAGFAGRTLLTTPPD